MKSLSRGLAGLAMLCLAAQSPGAWAGADVNNDGIVNILDISLVASCFGADLATNPQCQGAVRGPVEYRFIGFTDDATNMLADTHAGIASPTASAATTRNRFMPASLRRNASRKWREDSNLEHSRSA